jgi:hypothetical protein
MNLRFSHIILRLLSLSLASPHKIKGVAILDARARMYVCAGLRMCVVYGGGGDGDDDVVIVSIIIIVVVVIIILINILILGRLCISDYEPESNS